MSLCDYYVIFISHSYVASKRPPPPKKKKLNMLWICELHFKCSMSSLAVVFFLRPFLGPYWHFVLFWKLSAYTFYTVSQQKEIKLRYQGQLNHPTPRMTNKNIILYFTPCALGAPASDDLSVFEKKDDMLFFNFI